MVNIEEILPTAKKISKEYTLCENCLGRIFSNRLGLTSNKLLGKRIQSILQTNSQTCFICKNLFDTINHYVLMMISKSSDYSFKTFAVGTRLKPSIIERDDYIRSKYKLRGIDGIKTDITKAVVTLFSRKTKKTLNSKNPEITFTIDFKDESCVINSKYIVIQAKYIKSKRNIPQKQHSCFNCLGKGCKQCNFHGITNFDSIEGMFSKILFEKIGGTTAKYTWIGGEDKSSLVLGRGRLFFTKLNNPLKRKIRFPKPIKLDGVEFHSIKIINQVPPTPKFHSKITVDIETTKPILSQDLKKLKNITKKPVEIYEKSGKHSQKSIFSLKYRQISENKFIITILAEGGLPVKRFVNDPDVVPNISQLLGITCRCTRFDFLDVILQ